METPKRFTKEEESLLREFYPVNGSVWVGWKTLLPSRSDSSIRSRAHKMGLVVTSAQAKFTSDEERLIMRWYPVYGKNFSKWSTLIPGRTKDEIAYYAEHNLALDPPAIKKRGRSSTWNELEDTLIKTYYPVYGGDKEIWDEYLPNHTVDEIRKRAQRLSAQNKGRIWSDEEIALLNDFLTKFTEISDKSLKQVASRISTIAKNNE